MPKCKLLLNNLPTKNCSPCFLALFFLNTKFRIDSIQYQAALAIREAVKESLKEKLCQELSFESLKLSNSLVKLCFFFKVQFGELPQFLHDIIPNHTK